MGKMGTFMEFTKEAFNHLDNTTKDLTEEQLDWKSCPEANTIRWILGHLLEQWYGAFPKILSAGDKALEWEGYKVMRERALARGYSGVVGKGLEQIKIDLIEGKKFLLNGLEKLNDEDLAREIEWFRGKLPMLNYLIIFVAEIFHHEGQIAAIRGVEKRIKGL